MKFQSTQLSLENKGNNDDNSSNLVCVCPGDISNSTSFQVHPRQKLRFSQVLGCCSRHPIQCTHGIFFIGILGFTTLLPFVLLLLWNKRTNQFKQDIAELPSNFWSHRGAKLRCFDPEFLSSSSSQALLTVLFISMKNLRSTRRIYRKQVRDDSKGQACFPQCFMVLGVFRLLVGCFSELQYEQTVSVECSSITSGCHGFIYIRTWQLVWVKSLS